MVASLQEIGVGVLGFRVRVLRGYVWNLEEEDEAGFGEEKKMEDEKKEMEAISGSDAF